jgi:hypothetical protein
MSSDAAGRRPVLSVVRGTATDEEVAALVTVIGVLAGAGNASESRADASTSAWSDRSAGLRRPLQPGPGAWRGSAWQR